MGEPSCRRGKSRAARTLLSPLVCLSLAACSEIMPAQPDFSSYLVLPKGKDANNKDTYTDAQYKSRVTQVEPSTCVAFEVSPSPTPAARNACITDLMTDIDDAYDAYEVTVSNRIGATNTALDFISGTGSTVSAATSGTVAKVLSAISAVAISSKATISSDLLYKSSIQVVISTMRADRAKQAAAIKLAEQGSLATYPMGQAKNDLLAYLYAGTVSHALNDATQDAAATAQKCVAASKSVIAAVDSGKTVTTAAKLAAAPNAAAATTTSDQCNQLAESYTYNFDSGETSALLRDFLAPGGVVNVAAMTAANGCVKPKAPAGFDLSKYTLPSGKYDLATLASDPAVSDDYKVNILACAKAAMPSS